MGKQKRGTFSQSERKWDLEYFCRIGAGLRTFCSRRENFDLENICLKQGGKRNWT